jgi:hypothetical protein
MYAYDRIFTLTGEEGIKQLLAEKEQQKELERVIGLGVADTEIY